MMMKSFTNSKYRFQVYTMGDEIVLQSYSMDNNPLDMVTWVDTSLNRELIDVAIAELKKR